MKHANSRLRVDNLKIQDRYPHSKSTPLKRLYLLRMTEFLKAASFNDKFVDLPLYISRFASEEPMKPGITWFKYIFNDKDYLKIKKSIEIL